MSGPNWAFFEWLLYIGLWAAIITVGLLIVAAGYFFIQGFRGKLPGKKSERLGVVPDRKQKRNQ